MWKYNGNAYESYDDGGTFLMEGELNSHEGFWVELHGASSAYPDGVDLLIPVNNIPNDPPDPPEPTPMTLLEQESASGESSLAMKILDFFFPPVHAARPEWAQEWGLRLIAEAPAQNLKDRNNALGQLFGSVEGFDRHDLRELNPMSTPYLTIVFPHDDWEGKSGAYTSDYHAAEDVYAADQWVFQVRSDSPYRDIDLYWDGVYLREGIWTQSNGKRTFTQSKQVDAGGLLERMWLEDVETGERVDAVVVDPVTGARVRQSYRFNMDGSKARTFRWVLNSQGGKRPKAPKRYPSVNVDDHTIPPGLERLDKPPRPGLH
jgi:hypothetical protein